MKEKTRNGIIIGVAAICGLSVCSALADPQDTKTAETVNTTTSMTETINEEYDDDYIDVNAELNKITQEKESKKTTETTSNEITETTPQETSVAETETQEIAETSSITTTVDTTAPIETTKTEIEVIESNPQLQETQTSTAVSSGSSNNKGGNSSENHFTDYNTPEQQNTTEYVLNMNTKKFHYPTCSSVKDIKPENYSTIDSREDAINNGYNPCGRCHP